MKVISKTRLAHRLLPLLVILLLAVGFTGCGSGSSEGMKLYEQANGLFEKTEFTSATKLYKEAVPLLLAEGKTSEATDSREKWQTIELYKATYPYTESELKELLAQSFPDVPEAERQGWITSGQLEHMEIDKMPHYFGSVVANIKYRNLDLFRADQEMVQKYGELVDLILNKVVPGARAIPYDPYVNPATVKGTQTLTVARDLLPDTGTLKIWFPLPVEMGVQPTVNVSSITPDTYFELPVSTDQDIGLAYMEVPLDKLQGDLNATIQFDFIHYEARFTVDPASVGRYDKSSAEYKQYTASYGNIEITPEIEKKAEEVAGGEKNPYLAARKLYDYVVDNIDYSLMPHMTLWPRGEAESVYVHENGYGDCGAQSMYFCAMARSLGIPARCTGGFQLLMGDFAGHFWAEFFLPNYGWVPADTSVGQIVNFLPDATPEQKKTYIDYFFANQDHYRCNVQTDVDVPLIPPAGELVILPMAVQMPMSLCDTMTDQAPWDVINPGWTIHADSITEQQP